MSSRLVQIQNRSYRAKLTLDYWNKDVDWMIHEIQHLREDVCNLLAAVNCSDGIYTSSSECKKLVKDAITKIKQMNKKS